MIQLNWWVDTKRIDNYEDKQRDYAKRFRQILKTARQYIKGQVS